MEIKEHRLLLFIELYKETFGVTLTRSEAHAKASLLLQYVLLCLKPLAKINEDDINNMPD
jgi:hypothetical protein